MAVRDILEITEITEQILASPVVDGDQAIEASGSLALF
jgi:hypothetical protein